MVIEFNHTFYCISKVRYDKMMHLLIYNVRKKDLGNVNAISLLKPPNDDQ